MTEGVQSQAPEDQATSESLREYQPAESALDDAKGELISPAVSSPPRWKSFIAPAWFLFGVLVGLVAFAAYAQVTARSAPTTQNLDPTILKSAAREGMLEAIATLQAQSAQAQTQQRPEIAPVAKDAFAIRPANRLGNENAKVTLVEYADYQCPFCGRYHEMVEPIIYEEYIKPGKVNFVYKHMAFLGEESLWAALAAECAADQGKFWEYHDTLYTRQQGENQGAFAKDKLLGFAQELNLNMMQFKPCLENAETLERVRADSEEARTFGVSSTPTFFVNGQPMVGLQSVEALKQALDKALGE